jgi:hypothetical protein
MHLYLYSRSVFTESIGKLSRDLVRLLKMQRGPSWAREWPPRIETILVQAVVPRHNAQESKDAQQSKGIANVPHARTGQP